MIIWIYLALLLASFLKKKSKLLYIVIILFMWSVATFCTNIADESIYLSRYTNPHLWSGVTEFGFHWIILMCNKIGLSFVGFKGVVYAIQLLLIGKTVSKYAKYPNLVIMIYFVCPFPINVAQMRNALATAIMIYSVRFLLQTDKKEKKLFGFSLYDIKYILCIFTASLIHTASIIWIILIIAKKYSVKCNVYFMLVFNTLVCVALRPHYLIKITSLFGAGTRIVAYFSTEYQMSEWRHLGPIVYVLFAAAITLLACLYIKRKKSVADNKKTENELVNINLCFKMNIITMSILGIMLQYTSEVIRIQEGIMIINYMLITNSIDENLFSVRKLSHTNLIIFGIVVFYVVVYMWLSILLYLTETVWLPFWFNNTFWSFF